MSLDWMIEVLAELKTYAEEHGLPVLAAQLEIAMQTALLESAQDDSARDPARQGPDDSAT